VTNVAVSAGETVTAFHNQGLANLHFVKKASRDGVDFTFTATNLDGQHPAEQANRITSTSHRAPARARTSQPVGTCCRPAATTATTRPR
jgi:hypothetical protein